MRRRSVLASVCSVGVAAVAGCSEPDDVQMSDPRVETGPAETTLFFETGQETVANLGITHDYRSVDGQDGWGFVRFHTLLSHRENTHVDRLRYRLQHPVADPAGDSKVLLEATGSEVDYRFHRANDGQGVLFEIPDAGTVGDGTVPATFHVWPTEPRAEMDVAVDVRADLSSQSSGGGYALDAREVVTVPRRG